MRARAARRTPPEPQRGSSLAGQGEGAPGAHLENPNSACFAIGLEGGGVLGLNAQKALWHRTCWCWRLRPSEWVWAWAGFPAIRHLQAGRCPPRLPCTTAWSQGLGGDSGTELPSRVSGKRPGADGGCSRPSADAGPARSHAWRAWGGGQAENSKQTTHRGRRGSGVRARPRPGLKVSGVSASRPDTDLCHVSPAPFGRRAGSHRGTAGTRKQAVPLLQQNPDRKPVVAGAFQAEAASTTPWLCDLGRGLPPHSNWG